jgi:hypothetical protein
MRADPIRLLLLSVLPIPEFDVSAAIRTVCYYQRRNYAAHFLIVIAV